jgi:hypothetical protein
MGSTLSVITHPGSSNVCCAFVVRRRRTLILACRGGVARTASNPYDGVSVSHGRSSRGGISPCHTASTQWSTSPAPFHREPTPFPVCGARTRANISVCRWYLVDRWGRRKILMSGSVVVSSHTTYRRSPCSLASRCHSPCSQSDGGCGETWSPRPTPSWPASLSTTPRLVTGRSL